MRRAEIEALAGRWMRFWQGGGLDDFDEVHAPDFVDHGAGDRPCGRDGLRGAVAELYAAFPDFLAAADLVVLDAEHGLAAIRWTAAGTHEASFLGRPATHRRVTFEGIEILRCRDGWIVERWGEWNEGAILRRIDGSG